MLKHNKLKTYRFSDELVEKLEQLERFNIVESKFVRLAIEEKIQRDLPKIIKEQEILKSKEYCPF